MSKRSDGTRIVTDVHGSEQKEKTSEVYAVHPPCHLSWGISRAKGKTSEVFPT